MNSQVIFLPQEMKNGVGNGTNAQLNGSTVLNQAGTVLSNALFNLSHRENGTVEEGLITFYGQVNVIDMDQSVTVCPGGDTQERGFPNEETDAGQCGGGPGTL